MTDEEVESRPLSYADLEVLKKKKPEKPGD